MGYPCFLLTPVNKIRIYLRRYDSEYPHKPCPAMPGNYSYHDAEMVLLGDYDYPYVPDQCETWTVFVEALRPPKDDPRWPKVCKCGMALTDAFDWQMFTDRLMARSDNGPLTTIRDAPPGALWYAWWLRYKAEGQEHFKYGHDWDNQTAPPLICHTPGGDWCIDGRASNCTMPNDRTHRCWIRHGEPPNLHVDKNGFTCAAGAGSIQSGNYHGFLHNGSLT